MRCNMSLNQLNTVIEQKESIKISNSTLKKILNDEY